MRKTFRRITAVALAGLMTTCIAVTASAATDKHDCKSCKTTTTSTLEVASAYSLNAVATTSINDGSRAVSVSIYGEYWDANSGVLKTTGNGKGDRAGVTTSITNNGGKWKYVKSTHSRCCSDSPTILTWTNT